MKESSEGIKVLIVDDEEDARKSISRHLPPFQDEIDWIGEAQNAEEAEKMMREMDIDLLFLDIAMPRKSGFELLKSNPEFDGEVIFVTAYNEFAEKAFRY